MKILLIEKVKHSMLPMLFEKNFLKNSQTGANRIELMSLVENQLLLMLFDV